ncbi:MAG: chromosome segregation protein, partial [Alphaproteobacteria bacterium]|nr:chromosome segregation protein [Alphaproteobacteria bacterium]
ETLDRAERAARQAELDLAQANASQAGIEAEWRIAQAGLEAARERLARLDREEERQRGALAALLAEGDPDAMNADARARSEAAGAALQAAQQALAGEQARKADLQEARDHASETLASAKADFAGIEREHAALLRDREARAKQEAGAQGRRAAIDAVRAAPGYERALTAVLGRDAKARLGGAATDEQGRFWSGASAPDPVADSLAAHVPDCPPELAARLALVHVAFEDDGRALAPGHWLVTREGALRRWDGFVARGEGAAEAARLEADNRFAALDALLPARRDALSDAQDRHEEMQAELSALQVALVAREREVTASAQDERGALRALDIAEAARDRLANRRDEIERALGDLAEERKAALADIAAAEAARGALPDPGASRVALDAARELYDAARLTLQSATAALTAQDQTLAVLRERTAAQRAEISGWKARAGEAANRLAEMARRFGEIEEERAIVAAKPASLIAEIEAGETARERLGAELALAEAAMARAGEAAKSADAALAQAQEMLASLREQRAGSVARAENEEQRRAEMARISGERFQCPPPHLPRQFAFKAEEVAGAGEESASMDRLVADRERLGPVNLVAAEELAEMEQQLGSSLAEQAELSEAVNRLRGSIGNLNREGRERMRTAFEQVDRHFQRLFSCLFEGGQAHLALIDSDDPLEAGLEIFAQPPGKRLQSLTLLSGGEQALTAIALIFALFLTNPAPICVLDEVDAPLDDANIERFCDLLDAMVAETDTRYLIVTHNAVTMSRMHRLFGVTMIEKGVSRLVSVDLGDAEELLAAE